MATPSTLTWDLYVDGSLKNSTCGANLVLSSSKLECLRTEYALWLGFKASNNEAKYEMLLVGLRLEQVVRAKHLCIYSDFQLMAQQVNQEYQAKGEKIVAYLAKVQDHLSSFENWQIIQIP